MQKKKKKIPQDIPWSWINSVQFSHSVVSNSLQPHELQDARPPCPSPTPRVYSNSCPKSQWCHPAISSSVIPFSSCPQSLPAPGSFPMSSSSHELVKVLKLLSWIDMPNLTYFICYCLILFQNYSPKKCTNNATKHRAKKFPLCIKYHFHPQKGHSKSVSPNTITYGLYLFLSQNVRFLKTLVKEFKISVKGRKALVCS